MFLAVIFDIDGTLIDSVDQHARAWQQAFEHFGYSFPFERIRYQIGKGGDKLIPEFLGPEDAARKGDDIEKYRGDLFKKKYFHECKPFPKVRELFERLHEEHRKLAVASSGKKDDVDAYTKILGIDKLLDAIITGDDVERSKPDPDAVKITREKLDGLRPEQCIYVGDTPHDAAAARKDNVQCVGVLCGGFPEADIRKAGASKIFRDPEDLLNNWNVDAP